MGNFMCVWALTAVLTGGMMGDAAGTAAQVETGGTAYRAVVYREAEAVTEIPEVFAEDGEIYRLQGQEKIGERWEADFSLLVIFEEYGADSYLLNGQEVTAGEETPFVEDRGEELLALAGLDPAYYQVEEVVWDGESYVDENGLRCRKALASGRKRVWDVRAVYRGDGAGVEDVSEEERGVLVDENAGEVDSRGGEVKNVSEPSAGDGTFRYLVRAAVTALSLGAVLMAVGGGMYLWIWRRKRREEKKNGPGKAGGT